MSLTGMPLIALAFVGAAAVLVATILLWRRGRRLRLLARPLGVLLTEALLLVGVGLVVNRSEQFYPSWAALLQTTSSSTGTTFAPRPGDLDRWLKTRIGANLDQSVAFTWHPSGWTGWRLAEAPTIVTPTGYLQHPDWRYSALLVIDDGAAGWTPVTEVAAALRAGIGGGPAVIILARTTSSTSVNTLANVLPTALTHDLRVTGRRWALVASASDGGLAQQAAVATPGRYPAVALVLDAATPRPASAKPTTRASAAAGSPRRVPANRPNSPASRPSSVVAARLPAGIAEAVVGDAGTAHPAAPGSSTTIPAADRDLAAPPVYLAAAAPNKLETALVWACQQTPPPLAASTPPVKYVPIHHRPRHGGPSPSPTRLPAVSAPLPAVIRSGGSHVAGQPGR
jgi:hypothetical protein